MPFKSLKQEGYMHAHPEILGKKGLAEWDAATKGKHLPERKHMKKHKNKHGMKHTHITHHPDGSHTVEHGMHEGEPQSSAVASDGDLMAHMQEALGSPAEAGAPAAPAAAAPPMGA